MAHDEYLVTTQQQSYYCKYQIEIALAIMAKLQLHILQKKKQILQHILII